jgi:hypothetical protein
MSTNVKATTIAASLLLSFMSVAGLAAVMMTTSGPETVPFYDCDFVLFLNL